MYHNIKRLHPVWPNYFNFRRLSSQTLYVRQHKTLFKWQFTRANSLPQPPAALLAYHRCNYFSAGTYIGSPQKNLFITLKWQYCSKNAQSGCSDGRRCHAILHKYHTAPQQYFQTALPSPRLLPHLLLRLPSSVNLFLHKSRCTTVSLNLSYQPSQYTGHVRYHIND